MHKLTISLTDAEMHCLRLVAVDAGELVGNFARDRARVMLENIRQTREWKDAFALAIGAGVDPHDDAGVLMAGVQAGMFETLAARAAEAVVLPQPLRQQQG